MNTTGDAHGVIVALLNDSYADRIVLDDHVLYLRNGPCPCPVGTPLEVEYSVRDGRSYAEKITPTKVTL